MYAWNRQCGAGHTTLGATAPSRDTLWARSVRTCPFGHVTEALKRDTVDLSQGDQCIGGGRSAGLPKR